MSCTNLTVQGAFCGDGIIDLGEECDNNGLNGQACVPGYGSDCTYCAGNCANATVIGSFCGDGIVDQQEECDDNGNADGDGCNANCEDEFCGDSIVQQGIGEECEPPNTQVCDAACLAPAPCPDEDGDTVCDPDDACPDSLPLEPVNAEGCDPFQFCGPLTCGYGCFVAHFIPIGGVPENTTLPSDCTTVILNNEGTFVPKCVPTTCAG